MEVDIDFISQERQNRILKALQLRAREVRIQVRFVHYGRDAREHERASPSATCMSMSDEEERAHDEQIREEIKAWGHRAALTYELVIQPGEWGEKSRIRFVHYDSTGSVLYETPFHDTPEQVFERDFFGEEERMLFSSINDTLKFGYVETYGERGSLARPINDFIDAFIRGRIGDREVEHMVGFPVVGVFINDRVFGHTHHTSQAPLCATPDFIHTSRQGQRHVDVDDSLVQIFVAPSAQYAHIRRSTPYSPDGCHGALHMMVPMWIFAHDLLTRTPEHTTLNNVWRMIHDVLTTNVPELRTYSDARYYEVRRLHYLNYTNVIAYMRRPASWSQGVFENPSLVRHHEPTHKYVYRGFPIHPLRTYPAMNVNVGDYRMQTPGPEHMIMTRSIRFDVFANDFRRYVLEHSSTTVLPESRSDPWEWQGEKIRHVKRIRSIDYMDASDHNCTTKLITKSKQWARSRKLERVCPSIHSDAQISFFWLELNIIDFGDYILSAAMCRDNRISQNPRQVSLNYHEEARIVRCVRLVDESDPVGTVLRMLMEVRSAELQEFEQSHRVRVMDLPSHGRGEQRVFAWSTSVYLSDDESDHTVP